MRSWMTHLTTALLVLAAAVFGLPAALAQNGAEAKLSGSLIDDGATALDYANVVVYAAGDSAIAKVGVTQEDGSFVVPGLAAGRYYVEIRYVGLPDLSLPAFDLGFGESRDLGTLKMGAASAELQAATVTAQRMIVEIKADRTVFNVNGTINAAGGDGLSLLRKAPGVVLNSDDQPIVMGRSGVLMYIDGKRSPLSGEALTAYLRSLPAEQIDRIDIITNPGAKYEAEGNAGIIDIRLKKNENWGTNGSVSATAGYGRNFRGNLSGTVNHREGKWNTFATGGVDDGANWNENYFRREQNGLLIDDRMVGTWGWRGGNVKLGTDFRASGRHTFGVQVNGNYTQQDGGNSSRVQFSRLAQRTVIDSILIAGSTQEGERINYSANVNYRYDDGKGRTVNVDLDRGAFRNDQLSRQPNQFFGPDGLQARSREEYAFDTPRDIDITTAGADVELPLAGGKLGTGAKFTLVTSDNDFRLSQMIGGEPSFDAQRSNRFFYDERVVAGYLSYRRDFGPAAPSGQGKTFGLSAGLRAEHTDALGELRVYTGAASTMPVDRNYINLFPNAGLTWAAAPKHNLALSYGRRINRPNYEDLNPFLGFASLVTFEQGNPTLRPEIVNNVELAHTFAYRYTTKLSVSRTEDQITRLVRPDSLDERATYITFDNLGQQTVASLNVSIPTQVTKWWEVYVSATASHTSNVASYADGDIDLQQFSYNIYAQNTFPLPQKLKLEVSGWYNGPSIWGGTFRTRPQGALNLGVQRKFLGDKLNARLAVDDVFFTSGWRAESNFAGQFFDGGGNWESRRGTLSLSYNFGNDKVKVRQRQTGLDDAARRAGG